MALLPDLVAAVLYATIVFFMALGVLVVFVEVIRPLRIAGFLLVDIGVAVALGLLGEPGLSFVVLSLGCAIVANHVFERLTTR